MASTVSEIVSLCWLLKDIGVQMLGPMPMYCHKSVIQTARMKFFHEQIEHIEFDSHVTCYHYFKTTDFINLPYISSSNKLANSFTKSPITTHFRFLIDKVLMFIPS